MDSVLLSYLILITSIVAVVRSSTTPSFNVYGAATVNETTIVVNKLMNDCTSKAPFPNSGTLLYNEPLELQTNLSFTTHFTFAILPPPPPCLTGDGFAFFVTTGFPVYPNPEETFIAVEFDASYGKSFAAVNDNGAILLASSIDVNLVGGNFTETWIHYDAFRRVMDIWVGYHGVGLGAPVLSATMDLTERFQRSPVYVGFSGHGSSTHVIDNWKFKLDSVSGSKDFEPEDFGPGDCMISFPDILLPKQHLPVGYLWLQLVIMVLSLASIINLVVIANMGRRRRVRL